MGAQCQALTPGLPRPTLAPGPLFTVDDRDNHLEAHHQLLKYDVSLTRWELLHVLKSKLTLPTDNYKMMLASAPSTPDRAVQPPGIRRSFTAPIKSSRSAIPSSEEVDQGAETLYAHSACKIVSFNTSTSLNRRHSSVSDGRLEFGDQEAGTLPWKSTTERTIAAGPLRIYRVLGTAFLNSGDTLHPILPRSQCWCVDGESKLVLRIRPNSYYRIELPTSTLEENQQVEKLKAVLAKVLQYEVTPCPFKRGFYVELPEPPKTPIVKRPWRPKPRPEGTSYMSEELEGIDELTLEDSYPPTPANGETETSGPSLEPDKANRRKQSAVQSDDSSTRSTENEPDSEATDDTGFTHKGLHDQVLEGFYDFEAPARPKSLRTRGRTFTAPPQLTIKPTPPSTIETKALPMPPLRKEPSSLASSVDSFHSFHSPISPLPPSPSLSNHTSSPQELDDSIDVSRTRSHKRDVSEVTVRAGSPVLWALSSGPSGEEATHHSPPASPGTPTLESDAASLDEDHWSEAITPSPPTEIRRRIRSRRRTQSPVPSNSNLYAPYSPRSHMSGHHLTTAILQRTCSILLGPPIQLVALMLRIAAKIARGAFRGTTFGYGDRGQKIPCSWDFSDGSDENEDYWEEDDYGFSLSKAPSASSNAEAKDGGGSWEID